MHRNYITCLSRRTYGKALRFTWHFNGLSWASELFGQSSVNRPQSERIPGNVEAISSPFPSYNNLRWNRTRASRLRCIALPHRCWGLLCFTASWFGMRNSLDSAQPPLSVMRFFLFICFCPSHFLFSFPYRCQTSLHISLWGKLDIFLVSLLNSSRVFVDTSLGFTSLLSSEDREFINQNLDCRMGAISPDISRRFKSSNNLSFFTSFES